LDREIAPRSFKRKRVLSPPVRCYCLAWLQPFWSELLCGLFGGRVDADMVTGSQHRAAMTGRGSWAGASPTVRHQRGTLEAAAREPVRRPCGYPCCRDAGARPAEMLEPFPRRCGSASGGGMGLVRWRRGASWAREWGCWTQGKRWHL
jgi:hypothetical protein